MGALLPAELAAAVAGKLACDAGFGAGGVIGVVGIFLTCEGLSLMTVSLPEGNAV